ncbi:unnamed protein product [Owenia fusiformis]|uniref:Uncharacterized protein n=1 Tax=Owenia fusiformis TaxID=6347 RepID=A0A8J1TM94_OWEFU|nr:unnamed protein product [Owenia fusiformis]
MSSKCGKNVKCAKCEKEIKDKFVYRFGAGMFHSKCLICQQCRKPLKGKCYEKNEVLFCKRDFYRRFGHPCHICSKGILPTDMVHKTSDKVFHLRCFKCTRCNKDFFPGDHVHVLKTHAVLCKEDYMETLKQVSDEDSDLDADQRQELTFWNNSNRAHPYFAFRMSSNVDNIVFLKQLDQSGMMSQFESDSDMASSLDGNDGESPRFSTYNRRRGPRTTIKEDTLTTLKEAFQLNKRPNRAGRDSIAKQTGLPVRVIQVWFQNMRSKERRMKHLKYLGNQRDLLKSYNCFDDIPDRGVFDPSLLGFYPDPVTGHLIPPLVMNFHNISIPVPVSHNIVPNITLSSLTALPKLRTLPSLATSVSMTRDEVHFPHIDTQETAGEVINPMEITPTLFLDESKDDDDTA